MTAYVAEFVILNKSLLKSLVVELPLLIKFSNSNFIAVSFCTK